MKEPSDDITEIIIIKLLHVCQGVERKMVILYDDDRGHGDALGVSPLHDFCLRNPNCAWCLFMSHI